MPSSITEALSLIKDLSDFLKDSQPVFASPEDADYFRKSLKRDLPKPPPAPKIELPEILIAAPQKPPEPKIELPQIVPEPKIEAPTAEKVPEPKVDFQPPSIPFSSFDDVRKAIAKAAPGFPIYEEIPNDAIAKKISIRWKTKNQTAPISILSFHEPPQQRTLLEQIAIAIDVHFGPAKIINAEGIEKEKQWEAFLSVPDLKFVIACDYTLWQLNGLMQFYKENPAQGTRILGTVPVFLLPDLSLYLKDPLLKRSLWKALCQKCSS